MSALSIVTLPITPRILPGQGLLFHPFLMDVLGNQLKLDKILCLNVKGAKLCAEEVDSNVSGYIEANSHIGVCPDYIWRDDQRENTYWVNVFFRELERRGHIRKSRREIFRCGCGAVETLSVADNVSTKKRLYENIDGRNVCKLCLGHVVVRNEDVYLFKIPKFVPATGDIIPGFSCREIHNLGNQFEGIELLISRSRPSAFCIWTGRANIFLDVDFVWQLSLSILDRYGFRPSVLLGSHKNLFGCYLMLLLYNIISGVTCKLVIPGYVNNLKIKSTSDLNPNALRLFFASHTTFDKKELSADLSLLRLCISATKICRGGFRPLKPTQSLEETLEFFGPNLIRRSISKTAKTGIIDECVELVLMKLGDDR